MRLISLINVISSFSLFQYGSCGFRTDTPEDGKLDFIGIANKYGHNSTGYDVVTADGYILKVFRIFGDKTRPVFLMHGSYDSSDAFLVRGNLSLGIHLANQGYDVWAGNLRGNRYSRRHVRLNPDFQKSFWDFSIDEHALLDLPAMIDLVLDRTGQKKLITIGHSLGTTIHYALGAAKPEYNDKIKVMISLAPVCFSQYIGEPLKTLSLYAPLGTGILDALGIVELVGYYSYYKKIINLICSQRDIGYDLCVTNGLFVTSGADPEEFEPSFLPSVIEHFPAGASTRLLKHFAQFVATGRFSKFDYGANENLKRYGSRSPPDYDLGYVTMRIALLVGKNDKISTVESARALYAALPNVVNFTVLEPQKWNHLDFTLARNAYKHMFPIIFEIMKMYEEI